MGWGRGALVLSVSALTLSTFCKTSPGGGDSIFVNLLASLWGVRITIVRCDTLTEIRYRHEGPLKEVCIGLLYNGKEEGGGHYSPLVRVGGELSLIALCYMFLRSIMMRM